MDCQTYLLRPSDEDEEPRTCSFEPVKDLVREIRPYPDRRCSSELPSGAIEGI